MRFVIATQCFPPRTGGIENLMAGLALHLAYTGAEVVVLADGEEGAEDRDYGAVRVHRFHGWKPARRMLKAAKFRRLRKRGHIDGLFCDSWKSLELLDVADVPVACLAHGMEFPADSSRSKARRIRRAFEKASSVIANSRFTAALARSYLPAAAACIVVNPPIEPQIEPASDSARDLVDRLTLGGRRVGPILAGLGRLEPRKGFDRVLQALATLRNRYPEIIFALGGAGDDLARLKALADDVGVTDRVLFLGRLDDHEKAALLSASTIFCMPARREGNSFEGFGIVYLEAGWYGVPSVAGKVGGAADAVVDGLTGILCNGDDPAAVAAAIDGLLSAPGKLDQMGRAAAERARASVWRNQVQHYVDAIAGCSKPRQATDEALDKVGVGDGPQ
jgi:phosphatidyl-myo-inositol dimannoside synthase